jgi:hypothetical protein
LVGGDFVGDCHSYADTVGLLAIKAGWWKLKPIATAAGGGLVVWSGDACFTTKKTENGPPRHESVSLWQGVAIGPRLPIAAEAALDHQYALERLEILAARLQL